MPKKIVKSAKWCFILYPESAPENWREILQKTGLQCAISPLHDKDINPTGEPKKPHYHIIVTFAGPTTFAVMKDLTDSLKQPIPQKLSGVKGYYRYFTHKDNPEKAQYNENEITTINGFNILDHADVTHGEVMQIKLSILKLIQERDITEYADLIDYLADAENEMFAEFDIASTNTLFFTHYLSSIRCKRELNKVVTSKSEKTHEKTHGKCCPKCGSVHIVKQGKTSAGSQIFKCSDCGKKTAI